MYVFIDSVSFSLEDLVIMLIGSIATRPSPMLREHNINIKSCFYIIFVPCSDYQGDMTIMLNKPTMIVCHFAEPPYSHRVCQANIPISNDQANRM